MVSQPRRGRCPRVRSGALHRAGVVFALGLIALSLIGGSLAGVADAWAQADPQATEIPEVMDDKPIEDERTPDVEALEESRAAEPVTEMPQPTETPGLMEEPPVATKAVATETTPSPTEEPELGATGEALWASNHLEVDVHGCPAGVDAAVSSIAQLEATCGDNVGPVSFSLDNGWLGDHSFLTSGSSSGNRASFSNLDFEDDYAAATAGDGRPVVLAASMPAGYLSVVVSCTSWNAAAGVTAWGPVLMSMAGVRAIEIAVDAGDTLSCDWYFLPPRDQGETSANVEIPPIAPTPTERDTTTPEPPPPVDPEETGSVHIVKYTCDEGDDTSGAGFAALEEDCRDDAVLTEFTVATTGMYSETRAARLTLPPFMQEARFEDVPATTVSITETILPGFGEPLVYCRDRQGDGASWIPQTVHGGDTVYWKLEPESRLTCYFFNVQVKGEYSANVEIPGIAPKRDTVTVTKYTCPKGVVGSDENVRLYDQCQEHAGPVAFTVTGSAGYVSSALSDGSIPTSAEFTGVPFGKIEIVERVPKGYGEPLAFCSDDPGNLYPVTVHGDTVVWDLRADAQASLRCVFYNVPEGGDRMDPSYAARGLRVAWPAQGPTSSICVIAFGTFPDGSPAPGRERAITSASVAETRARTTDHYRLSFSNPGGSAESRNGTLGAEGAVPVPS